MDFKACKNCEQLHQMISGDRVKNVCLETGSIKQQSLPIECVHECMKFKSWGVSLWEVRDEGDCYVVIRDNMKHCKGFEELTFKSLTTNSVERMYFFSKNAAELTAASLNQEIYARVIQRIIEKRRSDGYENE